MSYSSGIRWSLDSDKKAEYIRCLTDELPTLRARLGITQNEIARVTGISRQTYSTVENGERPMSWSVYLALMFFFNSNYRTRQMLRDYNAFPVEFIDQFNEGFDEYNLDFTEKDFDDYDKMLSCIDNKGMAAVKTMLMIEFARCTNQPGDVVVKAYGKISAKPTVEEREKRLLMDVLRKLRAKQPKAE